MTKLSTTIPIKYIKESKKLLETYELRKFNLPLTWEPLTIADIIDSAEMLFGKNEGWYNGHGDDLYSCGYCSHTILRMCFNNKSIDEISKYIIKNIKD